MIKVRVIAQFKVDGVVATGFYLDIMLPAFFPGMSLMIGLGHNEVTLHPTVEADKCHWFDNSCQGDEDGDISDHIEMLLDMGTCDYFGDRDPTEEDFKADPRWTLKPF